MPLVPTIVARASHPNLRPLRYTPDPMDIHIEPSLTLILPSAIFRQKFHALQNGIAPIADTPEAIEIRDHSITA